MKKFRFYGEYTPDELPFLFRIFDEYSKLNQVSCEYVYFTPKNIKHHDDRLNYLKENEINIFRVGQEMFCNFNSSDYVDLSNIFDIDKVSVPHQNFCVKDNKLICVPDGVDGLLMFYNNKVLSELKLEVPRTWDEFVNVLREIKHSKPDLIPFALHNLKDFDGWWSFYLLQPFFAQAGIDFSNFDPNTLLDTSEAKEVFEFLELLIKEKLLGVLDEPEFMYKSSMAFAKEKAVFIHEGPWAIANVKNVNSKLIDHMGCTVLENKKRVTILGGKYFGMIASSPNTETAKDFMKHMTLPNSYYSQLADDYRIPAYKVSENSNPLVDSISALFNQYGVMETIYPNMTSEDIRIGNEIGRRILKMLD
jgi:ABC-type glycerol-3-phosphate transport system substrate-binding protein